MKYFLRTKQLHQAPTHFFRKLLDTMFLSDVLVVCLPVQDGPLSLWLTDVHVVFVDGVVFATLRIGRFRGDQSQVDSQVGGLHGLSETDHFHLEAKASKTESTSYFQQTFDLSVK